MCHFVLKLMQYTFASKYWPVPWYIYWFNCQLRFMKLAGGLTSTSSCIFFPWEGPPNFFFFLISSPPPQIINGRPLILELYCTFSYIPCLRVTHNCSRLRTLSVFAWWTLRMSRVTSARCHPQTRDMMILALCFPSANVCGIKLRPSILYSVLPNRPDLALFDFYPGIDTICHIYVHSQTN